MIVDVFCYEKKFRSRGMLLSKIYVHAPCAGTLNNKISLYNHDVEDMVIMRVQTFTRRDIT